MVQNRFWSGIRTAKTRTFPGTDVERGYDLVILNSVRLKKIMKHMNSIYILKDNLDSLKNPSIHGSFHATVAGKFAAMFMLHEEILREREKKKPDNSTMGHRPDPGSVWPLKRCKESEEHDKWSRSIARSQQEDQERHGDGKRRLDTKQFTEIEVNLDKNNSKRTLQVMKDLTQQRQSRVSTVQDKQGKCLTEEQEMTGRWTEYCSELYNLQINADPSGLTCQESANDDDHPILSEEVEAGTRALKNGKAAGVDNIPAELIKHGGETVPDMLTNICNEIWRIGEWPTPWTQ